jgi:hypothetical protein
MTSDAADDVLDVRVEEQRTLRMIHCSASTNVSWCGESEPLRRNSRQSVSAVLP